MTAEAASGGVLGRRALNRALLARQMLLRRHPMPAIEAIEHLVTVLVDGFVHGMWKMEVKRRAATLNVDLFEPVTGADRTALAEEGERLMAAAHPGTDSREVVFQGL